MGDAELKMLGLRILDPMVLTALGLGAFVIFIGFILGRRSRINKSKNPTKSEDKGSQESEVSSKSINRTPSNVDRNVGGSNKRAKNKKRRETQQEFTHSWIVGALKGHTGSVLDMNFSSDDKFLASCAEDCSLVPEEKLKEGSRAETAPGYKVNHEMSKAVSATRSSNNSKIEPKNVNISPSSSPTTSPTTKEQGDRASLSRRQRKNRRASREQNRERDDDNDDDNTNSASPPWRHPQCLQINNRFYQDNQIRNVKPVANGGASRNIIHNQNHKNNVKNEDRNNIIGHGVVAKNIVHSEQNIARIEFNSCIQTATEVALLYNTPKNDYTCVDNVTLGIILRGYVANPMNLVHQGYPIGDNYHSGYAYIIHKPHQSFNVHYHRSQRHHHLDVNAQEFVPSKYSSYYEADSGNGSGSSVESSDLEPESSSDSEKNSDSSESPVSWLSSSSSYSEKVRRDSGVISHSEKITETSTGSIVERECARCSKKFWMNDAEEYITKDKCTYHWGKKRKNHEFEGRTWQCCGNPEHAPGCTQAKMHVWTGLVSGFNGPLHGYVSTRPCPIIPHAGDYGVYALDCEMCYTRNGLEVTRVTVVGMDGMIMYDTLIKPEQEIIDYNTRFSGISAKDLAGVTTTLRDVQTHLTSFIYAETILIGHALENDLRALKIIHMTIIDTCFAYPHSLGYPHRSSLKLLAKIKLKRDIQVSEHDSVEDARIVIDLMRHKVWEDYFCKNVYVD